MVTARPFVGAFGEKCALFVSFIVIESLSGEIADELAISPSTLPSERSMCPGLFFNSWL